MGLNETRERFRELLPDELKGAHVAAIPDEDRERLVSIREGVLQAFEEAAPKPHPAVRIQTVDEYLSPGKYRRTFEVVDTRIAGKGRVIASVETREEAETRRQKAYLIPVGGKRIRPIGGAAYTYAAVDADEYWHDTDVETIASMHTYGVISGCTVTADAANMTVDLAAGVILHNALRTVAAAATDAWTLVADASNERWAALTVGSAGTGVLVSGDPAANASSEPAKPEIGDRVLVAFAKIQAAQTIAANVEYLLDKRAIVGMPSMLEVWKPQAMATTAAATGTANTAYGIFMEPVGVGMTITKIRIQIAVQNGNIDVGLYSWDGTTATRLAALGSTACPGVAVYDADISNVDVVPGLRYIIFVAADGATASFYRCDYTVTGVPTLSGIAVSKATSFPLPATMTSLSAAGLTLGPAAYGLVSGGNVT